MAEAQTLTVADVEQVWSVESAAAPFPWSRDQWYFSLEQDHCYGLFDGEHWQAVCALTMALDEATLLNIAVSPGCQGRGLARQLLAYAFQQVIALGARHCFLEVRESNQVARGLYASMGFEEIGRRKNYYPAVAGREDALVMMCALVRGDQTV